MGRDQRVFVCALVLLVVCLVQDGVSTPFVQRSLIPVGSSPSEDEGPCTQLQSSSLCMIDYPVPKSLAEIAETIEMEIDERSDDPALFRTEECMATAREIMCAQRFPRCEERDGDVRVFLTSLNCEERVRGDCGDAVATALFNRDFCDLQNSTHEATECKSLEEHETDAGSDDRLQYCRQDMQRQVTGWMYELMRYYDTRFGRIADGLSSGFANICLERQANFTCQLLGQCSEDGKKVESLNTYESCENFINCFPEAHANQLRELYDCSVWPQEVKPTPSSPAATTTVPRTWPSPPEIEPDQVVGNSSFSLHRLSLLALTTALVTHVLL